MSKKARNINKNKFNVIDLILIISPFLCGLMPLWSLCILGVSSLIGIAYNLHKNSHIRLPKGLSIYLILLYLISPLLTEFFAIDKGMNLLGFFKNIPIILFIVLLSQYDEDEDAKNRHFYNIAISCSISVLTSLFLMLFWIDALYDNNRLQGIFFYANSYGLFLLIGLLTLLFRSEKKWHDYLMMLILIIGIILTNSRAIIVMTPILIIASIFFNKQNLKSSLATLSAFILLFVGAYTISNMEKRVSTDMISSSEFTSRLIYYNDTTSMIIKNPLGLGYEGFWYNQAKEQTGVYDSKFVHSSILQVALDYGIIPTIVLIVLLGITFFNKKQTAFSRIIMIAILGHSIIDIDLEFIYFILIISLFIEYKTIQIGAKKMTYALCSILSILFIWLMIGDIYYNVGMKTNSKNKTTYLKNAESIIPFHTDNLQEILYNTTNETEQLKYASKILKYNKNVSGAYEALRNDYIKDNNFEDAIKCEESRVSLNKYKIYTYVDYADTLIKAHNYYKDESKKKECLEKIINIEKMIKNTLDETNPLCYKTIHPPELDIPSELETLIEKCKNTL